ncbi:hypothetical protein C8J57DRAFT_1240568 [Mycena rebaudengoi]|nr:hypothetical protein C8J57DRAFT_1240568 [Mycena rebaudengoi]
MPPLGGGFASGTTTPFVGSAIPQTEGRTLIPYFAIPSIEGIVGSAISQTENYYANRPHANSLQGGGIPATHEPFPGNPTYDHAGAQVARDSVGTHRQQLHIRPSPYSRASTIDFKSLRAMQESPQKSQGYLRKKTPAPVAPPQITSAGSVSTNSPIPDRPSQRRRYRFTVATSHGPASSCGAQREFQRKNSGAFVFIFNGPSATITSVV